MTALAEHATSLWPNKNEQGPRPRLGSPYVRVSPRGTGKPGGAGERARRAAGRWRRNPQLGWGREEQARRFAVDARELIDAVADHR